MDYTELLNDSLRLKETILSELNKAKKKALLNPQTNKSLTIHRLNNMLQIINKEIEERKSQKLNFRHKKNIFRTFKMIKEKEEETITKELTIPDFLNDFPSDRKIEESEIMESNCFSLISLPLKEEEDVVKKVEKVKEEKKEVAQEEDYYNYLTFQDDSFILKEKEKESIESLKWKNKLLEKSSVIAVKQEAEEENQNENEIYFKKYFDSTFQVKSGPFSDTSSNHSSQKKLFLLDNEETRKKNNELMSAMCNFDFDNGIDFLD